MTSKTLKIGRLYWTPDRGRQLEWTLFIFKGFVTYGDEEYVQGETAASTYANPADLSGYLISKKDVYSLKTDKVFGKKTHMIIKTIFTWVQL
jgi:hypothetical protein